MPRLRSPYPPAFREQMTELVRVGRTPEELSREFEPSAQTIRNWVKPADLDQGVRSDGLTSSEREELRRLKREVKQLRMEREIPRKAAAWFARESDSIADRDIRSPFSDVLLNDVGVSGLVSVDPEARHRYAEGVPVALNGVLPHSVEAVTGSPSTSG